MSDAFTPNLNLTKPEPGTSENTWGTKLNANFDKLDGFASPYLRSVSALALGTNQLVYATGSGTAATTPLTAFARSLLDDADDATARTTMGAVGAARQITAGDGLTGGGNLTADRTIAVDASVVRTGRSVAAGNGLTGGGDLSANRTITLGTPGTITGATTNSTSAGSHTHALDLSSLPLKTDVSGDANPRLVYIAADDSVLSRIGPAQVQQAFGLASAFRSVAAGNGLTGGGDLSANRTLTLGTPSSITSTSTNSVTATSHTHEISSATIRALTADSAVNQVGTYAMLRTGTSTGSVGPIRPGDTRAGSNLWYASASNSAGEAETSIRPSGTWRCMGYTAFNQDATLWLRIS